MQIQRVQNNNYNQTFGAKVSIDDVDKIIPKGVKRTFTKMCRDLGESTDEIYLLVGKGNQNVNGEEMDSFFGMIKEGLVHHHTYTVKSTHLGRLTKQFTKIEERYAKVASFMQHLPADTNSESMSRNLAKIYKDYILPVFYDNNITIKNLGDTAETKLLSAVAKSKN
ncbi:hypothetical protein J6G99_07495 [bacterium]|nr:hypothetical protein [bacterium]